MNFIRLLSKDDKMFNEAMMLYRKSFPFHEQRGNGISNRNIK